MFPSPCAIMRLSSARKVFGERFMPRGFQDTQIFICSLRVCVCGGGGAQKNPHSLQGVEDNSRKGTANIFRSAWRNIFRCEVRLGAFSSAIRDSSTKITGKLNCRGEMDSKFTLMQASYATEFPATTATLKDEIKWTPCSSSVTMTVSTDV